MGLLVFVFILLMFQALRYTEFVLIHGVGLSFMLKLIGFMAVSFLPALFPMSLLFSVLSTYSRLSQDSELLALKAAGLSMRWILLPAILFGGLVCIGSFQTSFQVAPWGNRQFELLVTELGNTKASASIREGTFSEGFFNLVIYANKVDSKSGKLTKVFIFDERDPKSPLAIVAKTGDLIQEKTLSGVEAELKLYDGEIHRKSQTHTKVNFATSVFKLSDQAQREAKAKTPPSLTWDEIIERRNNPYLFKEEKILLATEFHKRIAIGVACLIFAFLAVGLGSNTNKRAQKSGVVVICSGVILLYWILYVTMEGMARNEQIPPGLAMWTPNLIFAFMSVWFLRKQWAE